MEEINNNLHCGCAGLLAKKSKSSELFKFSMKNKEVKTKVFEIVKLLCCHIFATPFIRMENDLDNVETTQQYFDDVLRKIEDYKYDNSQQVFDDLEDILNKTVQVDKEANILILGSNGIDTVQK